MKKIITLVFLVLVVLLGFYLFLPVIKFGFIGIPVLLLLILFLLMISTVGLQSNPRTKKVTLQGKPNKWLGIGIVLLLVYIIIVPILTSATILHTSSYQKLIGEVKTGEKIGNHIEPISIDKLRVVDQKLAYLLGEKIIGSQPALGSQIDLGTFSIQKVNNELYWVAPLLHSGFFKWLNNQEGTPGYVMVSATNERDVKLVQTIDGQPVKIKFQPNAFFQSDLHRHVYMNGHASIGLTDFTFEVDESGKPFWVITTFDKKVGFSGDDATGILVVDAQSGNIQPYSIAEAPAWVDRIQPADLIETQLNDWGEYINGYWNFSNINKLQITEGMSLVYGKDNKSYWYTGLTSVEIGRAHV